MTGEIENVFPLTASQQGMLFHALSDPAGETFCEQLAWTMDGPLDHGLLRQAWQLLLDRNPALRTGVIWEGMDEPLQVVTARAEVPWQEQQADSADPAAFDRYCKEERHRGFELNKPPLMRVGLVHTGDRVSVVWTFHHMMLDGWSVGLLLSELAATYRALVSGQEPQAVRRRPFGDYIAWLQRQDPERSREFWQDYLAGVTEPTPLGVAEGRRVKEYGEQEITLDDGVTAALTELARAAGVTLNVVVEAAWALLLSCYSGRSDVLFGVTASGRSARLRGIESMVGMFINALPARVRVRREARLGVWLVEVQERRLRVHEHESVPFVQIREWSELPPNRPMFDSALVFENYPTDAVAQQWGEGIAVSDVRYAGGRADYPLTLFVFPADRLGFRAVYDARRADRAGIAMALSHLARLLGRFAEGADTLVGRIELLDAAERHAVAEWGRSPRHYPVDRGVRALFAERPARDPGALACVATAADGSAERLDYAELRRRAGVLAGLIKERQDDH